MGAGAGELLDELRLRGEGPPRPIALVPVPVVAVKGGQGTPSHAASRRRASRGDAKRRGAPNEGSPAAGARDAGKRSRSYNPPAAAPGAARGAAASLHPPFGSAARPAVVDALLSTDPELRTMPRRDAAPARAPSHRSSPPCPCRRSGGAVCPLPATRLRGRMACGAAPAWGNTAGGAPAPSRTALTFGLWLPPIGSPAPTAGVRRRAAWGRGDTSRRAAIPQRRGAAPAPSPAGRRRRAGSGGQHAQRQRQLRSAPSPAAPPARGAALCRRDDCGR